MIRRFDAPAPPVRAAFPALGALLALGTCAALACLPQDARSDGAAALRGAGYLT